MKKKRMRIWISLFAAAVIVTGCQKAPETANDDEILRAKGSSDEEIEAIMKDEDGEAAPDGVETVSAVLGVGENRMRIEAEIAPAPDAVSTLTMQADSRLNKEMLLSFLDPQGEVKDFTEELLAEEEAERQRVEEIDKKLGEESSIVEIASVGDRSTLALTDGNKKAVLFSKTNASFEDASLHEKCITAAQKIGEAVQELDVKDEKAGDPSFSLRDAKGLLMQKLSILGIEDIYLTKAYFYEANGFPFYDLQFCPIVGGLPTAYCFGQQDASRIYPNGFAYVSADGVAEIGTWNCLMEQASASEQEKILSFDKVQELLTVYLKDGRLQCMEGIPFSTAELVYYVELKDGKLTLAPAWGVYMNLDEYVEYTGETGSNDFVWTIHIDAVTGELLEVQ